MPTPDEIGAALSQYSYAWLPKIMKYVGWGFLIVSILVGFYFLWKFFQYSIGVYRFELGEMGDKDNKKYYVKRIKLTRAMISTHRGVDKFHYLWSLQKTDPVEERFMFPYAGLLMRKATFVYNIGRKIIIPSKLNINISPNPGVALSFTPIPFNVKRAASLELHEIAREFQDPGFMAKYGNLMTTIICVALCLILCGLVVFMTYKYIGQGLTVAADGAKNLASSLESMSETVVQKFG